MGAMLANEEVSQGFEPGVHAATFGGGALVSAVADQVLKTIQDRDVCAQVRDKGSYALQLFQALKQKFPNQIREIRGIGLMLGIEFQNSAKEIWKALLDRGYICNLTQERILRLLPPLVIEKQDFDNFAKTMEDILLQNDKL